MTETAAAPRVIRVDALSRIEGEGGLMVRFRDGEVEEVKLDVFEPPRFFEAFLRGRHFNEVADMTARICGICPVAHQTSAVQAIESALGVNIPAGIRTLRRLLYLGEWIESHALHIYLLHAPDFLGYESAISLAADHPQLVERALRLKKIGNELIEVLAGRATSPVSLCVGGFYKTPAKSALLKMREDLTWALEAAKDTAVLVANLTFPSFEADYELVALSDPSEYAICAGRIVSSRGLDAAAVDYEKHFREVQVEHSTALHSVRSDSSSSYLVGPLARMNLHRETLTPEAAELAATCGIQWPSRNPFHGIVARAIELVHACEESIAIIDRYEQPPAPRVAVEVREGEGCAVTEAPRGMLYHRYRIDRNGLVEEAKIIPPTSQNLRRMEDDLRLLLPGIAGQTDREITARCESLVRSYDPCISCSTHFLRVRIER